MVPFLRVHVTDDYKHTKQIHHINWNLHIKIVYNTYKPSPVQQGRVGMCTVPFLRML